MKSGHLILEITVPYDDAVCWPLLQQMGMTQQLLATHVPGSSSDRSARIGARTTQIDVVQASKTIEVCRWIVGIISIEKCLAASQHRVVKIATRKVEKLLQVSGRQKTCPCAVLWILDVLE